MSTENSGWKPGDVANGHQLGDDGVWRPVTEAPKPKRPFYKRPLPIIAMAVGLLVLIGLISGGSGDSNKPKSAQDKPAAVASASTEPAESAEPSSTPEPAAYDAATATPEEKWAKYQELMSHDVRDVNTHGVPQDEIESVSAKFCDNGPDDMATYVEASRLLYPARSHFEDDIRAATDLATAYCPEAIAVLNAAVDAEPVEAAPAPSPTKKPQPQMTASQEQAIGSAEDYLDYTGFSRTGLINQLVFEKFSKADATYAVDHIKVDWNEQAVRVAKDYLDYTHFSHGSLVDQLEYDGFTPEQAEYGVSHAGL